MATNVLLSRRRLLQGTAAVAISLAMPALLPPEPAMAAAQLGAPAPGFTLTSANGHAVSLADFRGKIVVLEWTNHDCPFVHKHYNSGTMQNLQRDAQAGGVVWLTIISSAPGEQGHVSPAEAQRLSASRGATPTAVLFDPDGKTGRAYGARTTPHMFIITGDGKLAYMGGIDDKPSANAADIATARPHVREALAELTAGKPVSTPQSRPYGCAIKYAS